jgi:hypothetical protein
MERVMEPQISSSEACKTINRIVAVLWTDKTSLDQLADVRSILSDARYAVPLTAWETHREIRGRV